MSSRAIRRLREERQATSFGITPHDDDDDEQEIDTRPSRSKTAFLVMMEESDDEESDNDDMKGCSESGLEDSGVAVVPPLGGMEAPASHKEDRTLPAIVETRSNDRQQQDNKQKEENLDAILAEFESQDANVKHGSLTDGTTTGESSLPDASLVLLHDLDVSDIDMEYVLRTSLLLGNNDENSTGVASRLSSSRRIPQNSKFLFGAPRDGWVRPPHLVGGGIGMTTYDDQRQDQYVVPLPYDGSEAATAPITKRWYTFQYSDTYQRDLDDFRQIQQSGDVNALALFVAHHPFVVEALLQLSSVLYQTNQSQHGLALLRRALFIWECSSLSSFLAAAHDAQRPCFMDYNRNENKPFFTALWRLMQVSSIAGCMRTSLAVSRYLLSLDPLRDPMAVLPILDHYALCTMNQRNDRFLVDLVECKQVKIHYQQESTHAEYSGSLLDLPNWSYSYALALFRIHKSTSEDDLRRRADDALLDALRKFPSVLEEILDKAEVDRTARSFRNDWPAVLGPIRNYSRMVHYTTNSGSEETILRHASLVSVRLVTKVFVERNAKLWSGDDTLAWAYHNCTSFSPDSSLPVSLSPAVIRYSQCDPADYEDRVRTLPQEVNPLDPALLALALAVDPNRRRFLRRQNMRQGLEPLGGGAGIGQRNFGWAPQLQTIDPDSPIMEVFWRSLLPWNHVEGVPQPRR